MTITYPTTLDTLVNPVSTDSVSTVDHATQHANANDAIEALEAKVGVNSSAVTTSHDYKLSGVTASDKAASLAGTEVLTNKKLSDSTTTIVDVADNTKAVKFDVTGTTGITGTITTAFTTAKTLTMPDATDTVVAKNTTDVLTNKTITSTTNNVMAKSLASATTTVDVSAATAPSNGQVLTATSSTTATWQGASIATYSGASASKTGTSTIVNSAAASTIAWDSENFDSATYHDNVTNNSRLTVPSNGKYLVTATVLVTSNLAAGYAYLTLLKNGATTFARGSANATNDANAPGGVCLSTVLDMATNDYVEVTIAGNFGSGTLTYGATGSNFTISKIGS